MAILCILGLHTWDGCKCVWCDSTRDEEHDWTKDCEKCCQCGATRQGAHQWDGNKCSRCGKLREEKK